MHPSLALLCVSIVTAPGCAGLPTPGRSAIDAVISIAGTTLVHIEQLNLTENHSITTPAVEGLSGAIHYLALRDAELRGHDLPRVCQVREDVSSLVGRLRSLPWAAGCDVPDVAPVASHGGAYPDSQLQLTLMQVHDFLGKFKQSRDMLMVC